MGLRTWWRRRFGKDVSTFTDEEKVSAYVLAGTEFGDVVSMIYLGECIGFDALFEQWERTERAYSELGFRTLSVDDFIDAARSGRSIEMLLQVPRKMGETCILHASYYREHFLHKNMVVDITPLDDKLGGVVGYYVRPSTSHLTEK